MKTVRNKTVRNNPMPAVVNLTGEEVVRAMTTVDPPPQLNSECVHCGKLRTQHFDFPWLYCDEFGLRKFLAK
jgi:hypothetical protein